MELQGAQENRKRVYRGYRVEGLCVKRKKRKRCVRVGSPMHRLTTPNQGCAIDFTPDVIATGRAIRIVDVVDVYTRRYLALEFGTGFASRRSDECSMSLSPRTADQRPLVVTIARSSPAWQILASTVRSGSSYGTISHAIQAQTAM